MLCALLLHTPPRSLLSPHQPRNKVGGTLTGLQFMIDGAHGGSHTCDVRSIHSILHRTLAKVWRVNMSCVRYPSLRGLFLQCCHTHRILLSLPLPRLGRCNYDEKHLPRTRRRMVIGGSDYTSQRRVCSRQGVIHSTPWYHVSMRYPDYISSGICTYPRVSE